MGVKLVDMELDDEQKIDFCAPMPCDTPDYPYGLRICLDQGSLDKLKTNAAAFKVGDIVDMRCFGTVTSVSMDETSSGERGRVEIQIQKIGIENENSEPEMEVVGKVARRASLLYNKARA